MKWFQLEENLNKIENSEERRVWREEQAYDIFYKIKKKLPVETHDITRLGAITVKEVKGIEGKHFWIEPIEGYPRLLAPLSEVKLFNLKGEMEFEGQWQNSPSEYVLNEIQFLIWLKPKREKFKLSFFQRLQGAWRYLKR